MNGYGQPPRPDLSLAGRTRIIPEANLWNIISAWTEVIIKYLPIVEDYEAAVVRIASTKGTQRRYLKLKPQEILNLVDFDKLKELRESHLFELKEMTKDSMRDHEMELLQLIDRCCADVYHTVSIFKEVHTVLAFVAKDYQENQRTENERFLAEAHEEFPVYVHRIEQLLLRLRSLFNRCFAHFRQDEVFIRSLYLYGREQFSRIPGYFNGLDDVYTLMYYYGPLEGYFRVSESFKHAGFEVECAETRQAIVDAYGRILERVDLESGEVQKIIDSVEPEVGSTLNENISALSDVIADDPWLERTHAQVQISSEELLRRTIQFIYKIEQETPSGLPESIRKASS